MPDGVSHQRRGALPGDVRVVVQHRRVRLPRMLGPSALFSACYGNVGSSIYYALGVTAAYALGLTPLAMILAGGIFVTTALNYAEGTAAIPKAGGSSSFARRAFNESAGFLVGWIQLLNYTATVSISAYFAIGYLGIFGSYVPALEMLRQPEWHAGAAVALTGVLILVNVVGIQESSLLNLILALLDLATQLVLVVLGLWLLLNITTVIHNIHLGVAPTWGNFLASISIAMVTYTGIETISNMSEEARNPGRSVPRATFAVIAAVLFVSAFLPTIGMSVFPVHPDGHGSFTTQLATHWKNDPVAGIVTFFRPEALAFWAGVWVAILAFTILVIATNAGLIGISRLSYSLASHDLFPGAFSRLHPRFRTPFVSIIVFGVVAALLIVPAQIDLMASVYSLAATFAFATAHIAVMRLRFVEPHLRRPFRMPLNIRFGHSSVPLLSVLGALGIGAVFTQLFFQNIQGSTFIYVGWLAAGVLIFVAYRTYRRKSLWQPLATPQPRRAPAPVAAQGRTQAGAMYDQRVHVGRRDVREATLHMPAGERRAERLLGQLWSLRNPRRALALAAAVACAAIAPAAVLFDLSSADPFGPGLGWSPGVVLILALIVFLLVRDRPNH
ncbi:MAG TPA: APC family permease [Candidatus Dormibacteraeota bacterium]|nr:APC family permease [Candidatus Dormibacteraeota bacterium]